MSKDIKFKLTGEKKINAFGVELFRIEATVDIEARSVKKGDKGGWVESKRLSNGNARVSGDAWVYGDAEVYGDAWVFGDAEVYGNARVYGDAEVYGNARVYGDAEVFGDARVYGDARVSGDAWVYGDAEVFGDARVYGDEKAQYGYWFAHHAKDANITKREMPDGYITLVQNHKAPDEKPEEENFIEIEGQKYTVAEIKKALGKERNNK